MSKQQKKNLPKSVTEPLAKSENKNLEFLVKNFQQSSWMILGVFMLIIIFIRARFLGVPLERDEGEYAYMGQLLLNGYAPYEQAYNMKYPGTAIMYALFTSIFGATAKGIHTGLLVTNLVSISLVYLVAKNWMNKTAAIMSAVCFGVLSLGYQILGFALHATHFVTLFALAGAWLLLEAFKKERLSLYFWGGIFFSLSFIMKQSGMFFMGFAFMATSIHLFLNGRLFKPDGYKKLAIITLGLILPFVIMLFWIYASGAFDKFWFWTYTYLKEYGTYITFSRGIELFIIQIKNQLAGKYILYLVSILGFLTILFPKITSKETKILMILFIIFSFLTVVPGLYFRAHYFITLLPALSICAGFFVENVSEQKLIQSSISKTMGIGIIVLGCIVALAHDKEYLFKLKPNEISRNIYGLNPFPESGPIAKYIKSNSNEKDRIAVVGSEPQIYFLSERVSSTGYIYTYNMMETHQFSEQMQKEMAKEIETNPPKFIVYVLVPTSWSRTDNSNMFIFNWTQDYLDKNYIKTGVVDFISKEEVIYKWDAEATNYSPRSQIFINVYKRK